MDKTQEKNLRTSVQLAEYILIPVHAKISILPNPIPTHEWVESQGQRNNTFSNLWTLDIINSDFGVCKIQISDRFANDVVKNSQTIAERILKKLKCENFTQQDLDYIYIGTKNWETKLKEM